MHREITAIKENIERDNKTVEDTLHHKKNIKDLGEQIDRIIEEAGEYTLNQDVQRVEPQIIVFFRGFYRGLGHRDKGNSRGSRGGKGLLHHTNYT